MSAELGVPALAGAVVLGAEDPADLLVPTWDYARRPLSDAFENLDEVLVPLLREAGPDADLDTTVYYSDRKDLSEADEADLLGHNDRAYAAARSLGGLIIYFQGPLLVASARGARYPELDIDVDTPNCMSFCIWDRREQARAGSEVAEHRAAVRGAPRWFSKFDIVKFQARLETVGGDEPVETVRFEPSSRVL